MKRKCLTIGIILLFVGTCIIPSLAQNTEKPLSTSRGSWLYVGGSGLGNYTRIQDAIDNASDGDTVFVYDDASPYYEHIIITSSISLLGENKTTTIIEGAHNGSAINITADDVTVTGFTIQNCNISGILLFSNNTIITDNILSNNQIGISNFKENLSVQYSLNQGHNTITKNRMIYNKIGISLVGHYNTTISRNIISESDFNQTFGITLIKVMNINISFNNVSGYYIGFWIFNAYNTTFYRNTVFHNRNIGVWTMFTSTGKFFQNNFIANNMSALSFEHTPYKIRILKGEFGLPIRRNVWNGNYWDRPRSLPYMIPGFLSIFVLKLGLQFDWHPAQKPYHIGG